MVGFSVAVVLIEHVRGASLNLRVDYLAPQPLGLDCLFASLLFFVFEIEFLKFLSPAFEEPRALIRTH